MQLPRLICYSRNPCQNRFVLAKLNEGKTRKGKERVERVTTTAIYRLGVSIIDAPGELWTRPL